MSDLCMMPSTAHTWDPAQPAWQHFLYTEGNQTMLGYSAPPCKGPDVTITTQFRTQYIQTHGVRRSLVCSIHRIAIVLGTFAQPRELRPPMTSERPLAQYRAEGCAVLTLQGPPHEYGGIPPARPQSGCFIGHVFWRHHSRSLSR